jgi:puromycin-sensitive aminopeptidase
MSKKVKRLFEGFQPTNYKITLDPNRDSMKISGTVTIRGKKVGRPSQRLTFHQNGLTITSAHIIKHDKKNGEEPCELSRINHQRTLDEVRLHADHLIYPGEYTVTMEFTGDITRPMEGIYPCFFEDDGTERQLIATQFESHHAREAFPCVDEPEAKATFDLTLISPHGEEVLANTPIKNQERDGDTLTTTFETTPKMSTYLVAFVYGDMKYKEAKTRHGVTVRTYATPHNVDHTDFALDVAVKCLEFYTDYFNIPYPLEKCDLIALPDFASGAMENWGCITFREQCLFVDSANTSLPTKQYVAMVVAHELAHQWFGNLVTMRWWTDLWLNEGFASWIEYLAVDHIFTEWDMWTQFIVDEQYGALKLDALQNTHPIEVAINHPDEIRSIFDAISYSKGSSVIHMLHEYLGPETFRDGLRHYLDKHQYDNTDTVDLWAALEAISKKPVKEFMTAWTSEAGYPIVKATIDGTKVALTQKPFLINPLSMQAETAALWPIPLRDGDTDHDVLTKETMDISVKGDVAAYRLNHDRSGFYRTIYDEAHLAKLAQGVVDGSMNPLDRLGLLNDAFEAAKAGYSPTVQALQLLESYTDEDNSVVWDIMGANLSAIRSTMNDEELRESMKSYCRTLVAKQLTRLGWEEKADDSHFDKLLRPLIIGIAAISDEPAVVDEALRRFDTMEKPEDIAPDLRGIIYVTAARLGDEKTFEKLLAMHNASQSSEERVTLAAALTSFKQPELIQRALDLVTTNTVRLQDVMYWIAYSFGNRFARDTTWKWLMDHWAWIGKNLGSDLSFYRMPVYAARNFSDADFLLEYKQFFESVMEPSIDRAYKQGVEMIQWQSEWRKRDLESIKQFFDTHK